MLSGIPDRGATLDQPVLSELQAMIEELKAAYADFAAAKRGKSYLNISDAKFATFLGLTKASYSQHILGYNKPSLETMLKFFAAFKRLYKGMEGEEKAYRYLELLGRTDYIDLCQAYYLIQDKAGFEHVLRNWDEMDDETQKDIINVAKSSRIPPKGGPEDGPPEQE